MARKLTERRVYVPSSTLEGMDVLAGLFPPAFFGAPIPTRGDALRAAINIGRAVLLAIHDPDMPADKRRQTLAQLDQLRDAIVARLEGRNPTPAAPPPVSQDPASALQGRIGRMSTEELKTMLAHRRKSPEIEAVLPGFLDALLAELARRGEVEPGRRERKTKRAKTAA
jgi:hypothetical protein